jgi:aerobic-type carbon monoxide dehydrogenase small subunit (CoxS/CutS family)
MATPKERKIITAYGKELFKLFREQQRVHGHEGCNCGTCEADMVAAFQKLVKQKKLSVY